MTDTSTSQYLHPGGTAVITGASTGIGKAAAFMCAAKGMNVYLVDIDEDEVAAAATEVKKKGSPDQKIEAVVSDVSDEGAMRAVADTVFAAHGEVSFLMNNAGTGKGGGALESMDTVQKVFGVNTYGPINGCLAFIPKMKESGRLGLIVNTGSKQGITMPPGNLTYNMSKAALKAYTEGLEHELCMERIESGGKLRAALLIPGWVNTSIVLKVMRDKAEAAGETFNKDDAFFHEDKPASGAWMPSQVIDFMIAELEKGKFYVVCPDNDVDRETDNLRMLWTANDIIQDRPPLSRWHPEYKDKFDDFLKTNRSK
mmetsp:Transcript_30345/g.66716  ORF Transcript_30345/g.66716 Transcript_30345/m.66716 type:complete len:313 (-) Transcript_30345:41-979(-)